MNEMTLSSRHRIRNSSPGGLRSSTLPLGWMGKKHFCCFQTTETGNRTPNSSVKGSGANHYPRAVRLFSVSAPADDKNPAVLHIIESYFLASDCS